MFLIRFKETTFTLFKNIYSIISVAFVLEMHSSIILLLFALGALVCGDDVEKIENVQSVVIPIKNGLLEITVIKSLIFLNLTKNGELHR